MGGSLEAFKLFNALGSRSARHDTGGNVNKTTTTTTDGIEGQPLDMTPNIKSSSSTPSSTPTSDSAASPATESVSTPASEISSIVSSPSTRATNTTSQTEGSTLNQGLKLCLANTQDYTRRQQSLRDLEDRLAAARA